MEQKESYCFFRGKFIHISEANINIQTHALQYATACFGGIRGYYNSEKDNVYLLKLEEHFVRLQNSAKILQMKLDYTTNELCQITKNLVQRSNWRQNIYIRPFLYASSFELTPYIKDIQQDFAMYIIPLNDYLDTDKGLSTCISSYTRIADNQIPTKAKASAGYLNSALAKSEALQRGFDESIFLDIHGNISEGSAENIFIVKNNVLITPDVNSSILEGITRNAIIYLAKESKISVIERTVSRSELYTADEVFFCGTGVQVSWIKSVDHQIIGTGEIGPITQKLQSLYFKIVLGKNSKYSSWLTPVY